MDIDRAAYRLWRVRRTIYNLCHDRGYLVSKQELEITEDEFKEKFGDVPARSELTILVHHKVCNLVFSFID